MPTRSDRRRRLRRRCIVVEATTELPEGSHRAGERIQPSGHVVSGDQLAARGAAAGRANLTAKVGAQVGANSQPEATLRLVFPPPFADRARTSAQPHAGREEATVRRHSAHPAPIYTQRRHNFDGRT